MNCDICVVRSKVKQSGRNLTNNAGPDSSGTSISFSIPVFGEHERTRTTHANEEIAQLNFKNRKRFSKQKRINSGSSNATGMGDLSVVQEQEDDENTPRKDL
jgi:hypothetical protein